MKVLGLSLMGWALACAVSAEEEKALFNGRDLAGWKVVCRPADAAKAASYWSVKDGAIECNTAGDKAHHYVWLMTEKEYGDFDLRLEVQSFGASTGNSGVQVRSRWVLDPVLGDERAKGWLDGPQIDLHPRGPWRCGFVYDETWEERRWIYPSKPNWKMAQAEAEQRVPGWRWVHEDGAVVQGPKAKGWAPGSPWNKVRIRCEGTRIQTWINEVPVTDFEGKGVLDNAAHRAARVGMRGHIALQLHSKDDLRIRFRNIVLAPL